MNTAVEYKRPGRNRYGEYRSTTFITSNGIAGNIKISLVWFNSLGWYYAIELSGWKIQRPMPTAIILEHSNDRRIWRKGKELSLCAEAAEAEATRMCEAHGIIGLTFEPYILPRSR